MLSGFNTVKPSLGRCPKKTGLLTWGHSSRRGPVTVSVPPSGTALWFTGVLCPLLLQPGVERSP